MTKIWLHHTLSKISSKLKIRNRDVKFENPSDVLSFFNHFDIQSRFYLFNLIKFFERIIFAINVSYLFNSLCFQYQIGLTVKTDPAVLIVSSISVFLCCFIQFFDLHFRLKAFLKSKDYQSAKSCKDSHQNRKLDENKKESSNPGYLSKHEIKGLLAENHTYLGNY